MDNHEAILRIRDHMRVHKIGVYPHIKICEALNMAICALEESRPEPENNQCDIKEYMEDCAECGFCRPAPENKPLTLEQLRAMDQKPVWVKEITTSPIDWDYWGIVDVDFACAGNWGTGAVISPATNGQSRFAQTPFSDYGSTWLAYRHPPKEDTYG